VVKQKIEWGTWVKWTSQSGSYEATKVGEVVFVLPAGMAPFTDFTSGPMKDMERVHGAKPQGGTLLPRKHESYIVLVRNPSSIASAPKLYWPIVSNLRITKRPA
jgi:hypothetical protein